MSITHSSLAGSKRRARAPAATANGATSLMGCHSTLPARQTNALDTTCPARTHSSSRSVLIGPIGFPFESASHQWAGPSASLVGKVRFDDNAPAPGKLVTARPSEQAREIRESVVIRADGALACSGRELVTVTGA